VRDVDLIRHAYVHPDSQRHGIGGALLEHLRRLNTRRMLVGTWAAVWGYKPVLKGWAPTVARLYRSGAITTGFATTI
jgi:GNAT superfamily N-acetyltransferase